MEELKAGTEIPTPEGIRLHFCENCIFYNCEVFLNQDIEENEMEKIGTIAGLRGS